MVGQLTRLLSSVINSRACASIVSCEWLTNETFLSGRLFPDRYVISVRPLEPASRIIRQLPSEMKFVFFHINGTRTDKFIQDRQRLLDAIRERGAVPLNAAITDILACPQTEAACSLFLTAARRQPRCARAEIFPVLNWLVAEFLTLLVVEFLNPSPKVAVSRFKSVECRIH